MWHIETEPLEQKKSTLNLKIHIDHELFKSFLLEREKVYKRYIQYNTNWLNPIKPFQPFVSPFPADTACRVRTDAQTQIQFPRGCVGNYQKKYQRAVVRALFNWLEEEYKLFQLQWKLERSIG